MYLKELQIQNWQCIHSTKIDFRNLMLFIGQSNSGKSSILSAIMCFLNKRKIFSSDLREDTDFLEFIGVFSLENDEILSFPSLDLSKKLYIKFHYNIKRGSKFYYKKNRDWVEIKEEIYSQIINKINLIFLPTLCDGVITEKFINFILTNLDVPKQIERLAILKIVDVFHDLKSDYTSHGFYRNLIFEIIKEIHVLSKKFNKNILPNTIIIFEEPELYLHPQREKELFSYFTDLSNLGLNIYISTHSSNFVSLYHYPSICVVRKNVALGTRAFQFHGRLFRGDEVKKFNMNYWINPDRSALFFAKKVILVEGQTDKIVLGFLAKKLGIYKYDYSIIECGSKSIIPQFIRLLNAFKIPYVAVYDKDAHHWRTKEEKEHSRRRNIDIQNKINKKIGSFIELNNDIEEEIYNEKRGRKNYKNKPYAALCAVSEKNYVIPDRLIDIIKKIFK